MSQSVMKANPISWKKIAGITEKLLKDFCPEALKTLIPLDVERMFEIYIPKRFQIETAYENLSSGIHGYTDPNKLRSVVSTKILDSDDISTIRFARSTIGHEIAHCVLHAHQFKRKNSELKFFHDENHSKLRLFRQEDIKPYENPEKQAWEFCKCLFLPEHLCYEAVEEGMQIWDIAERVNLNPAFIEVRLKKLKLI